MKVRGCGGLDFFFLSFFSGGRGMCRSHSPMHLLVRITHWLGSHSTSWVTSQPLTFHPLSVHSKSSIQRSSPGFEFPKVGSASRREARASAVRAREAKK